MENIIKSVSTWLKSKRDLRQAYENLERIAKTSIENIAQAEIDATIQTLVANKTLLEAERDAIYEKGILGKKYLEGLNLLLIKKVFLQKQ